MTKSYDYIEMAFRSIECFSKDGKLKAHELGQVLAIAERDGTIDQNEIRVLRKIIGKIKPSEVDRAMRDKLQEISNKINN
ncbi:hypothetical protein [Arenicella xantha]|nr:hypothetical protein [Arenicella xantha]